MKFILNNKQGFTLLEAIVALMISSLTLSLFTFGLNQLKTVNDVVITKGQQLNTSQHKIIGDRQIEWHIFLNQLESHLKDTAFIEITDYQLVVNEWNDSNKKMEKVKYHRTQSGAGNFRRSKSNGNNTMLTDIKNFKLAKDDRWLVLDFTFKNGENYKGKVWIESWKKENIIK